MRNAVLPDGRALAYEEYGAAAGKPLLFFHGWPGSRLDFAPNDAVAREAGLRVIAVDRPGIGGSTPAPGRGVAAWPADVAALADAIGLERFAVSGFSMGGAYARACGHQLPGRVTAVGLVACLGPIDDRSALSAMSGAARTMLGLARRAPPLALPLVWVTGREAKRGRLAERMAGSMAASDRELIDRPEVAEPFTATLAEGYRQGAPQVLADGVAVAGGDGFAPSEISVPVLIWHGEDDANAPVAMARDQERSIPGARARYFSGEGHLILYSRAAEIFSALARA